MKKLFDTDPFNFSAENKQLFIDSLRANITHHGENNSIIKNIFNYKKFKPSDLKTDADLEKLPYLMVNLFKEKDFLTGNASDLELVLTSSGTSGQKSQMKLNLESLNNVKKLAYNVYDSLGACSEKTYNYLCFTYDPKIAADLGTAFTDELLTSFTKTGEVYYAIKWRDDLKDWHLDEDKVVEKLKEFSKSNLPTRILGFPAFLFKIIKDHNLKIDLGSDSWLLTGGGWKNHADEEIPKIEFRSFIKNTLGIPEVNQRDLFGMVEHGIPYVDCENGHLRIPNYSRVLIRDPKTLKVLGQNEVGLIQFICSYNTSYPNFNILTTDLGKVLTSPDQHPAQVLQIIGRAGVSKHKGCAIKALEILR